MEVQCKMCGKTFKKRPSQTKKRYCSVACRSSDPEYVKARVESFKRSELGRWRATRKQIYNLSRKIYLSNGGLMVCHECGTTKNIHLHHINENRLDNSPNNLKALCNSCHNILHITTRKKCSKCNQLLTASHKCPSKYLRHKWAKRNVAARKRCRKCGRLLGKDKHVCGPHPRGFLGYHHTKAAKISMRKKVSVSKKEWWKNNIDWRPSAALIKRRTKKLKEWWTEERRKERSENMKKIHKSRRVWRRNDE